MTDTNRPTTSAAVTTSEAPATHPSEAGPTEQTLPPQGGLQPAQMFGHYRVDRRLGGGGMGAVYLVFDTQLERNVALKVPHFQPEQRQDAMHRFVREARSAARLLHPNICPVYEVRAIAEQPYLTMAYIEGAALSATVETYRTRPLRDTVSLIYKIALALAYAHEQGVVHRDLKPGNIMMTRAGEPIITDFGLAKQLTQHGTGDVEPTWGTLPGSPLGTPAYMPPEQAEGKVELMGPACDIYSLGVMFYQLLAGKLPFEGGSAIQMMYAHTCQPVPPLSALRPDLPPALEAVCLRCLAKQIADRPPSMRQLAQELEAFLATATTIQTTATTSATHVSETIENRFVQLFRRWGWERGLAEIRQDGTDIEQRTRLVQWLEGGDYPGAPDKQPLPALRAWREAGQVWRGLSQRRYSLSKAHQELEHIETLLDPADTVLLGSVCLFRSALFFRGGTLGKALRQACSALELLGKDHFLVGHVLDRLGRIYSRRNNFHSAREFFQHALASRERHRDRAGIAITHGHLGWLHFDWGWLDKAEEHFQADYKQSRALGDENGRLLMAKEMARVEIQRGEHDAAQGRVSEARRHWKKAAEWIDDCLRSCDTPERWNTLGYAHKERGLLAIAEGDLVRAADHLRRAEEIFLHWNYREGMGYVFKGQAVVARLQGRFDEAQRLLHEALRLFHASSELSWIARTQLELARTLRAQEAMKFEIGEAYLEALELAERSRRPELVRTIETELQAVDEEVHWKHVYQRVRGSGATLNTSSLFDGQSEVASVIFLNLVEFIPYTQGLDPVEVMLTLNQVLAELSPVLAQQNGHVTAYLGGGFMALFREARHAVRAVQAALDLHAVMNEYNRPRAVLRLPPLGIRIGVATGPLFVGNIGTYRKVDFTAIGMAANLASRLMREADTSSPCISSDTYQQVREQFTFKPGAPRSLELRGIGRRDVWDVHAPVGEKGEGDEG